MKRLLLTLSYDGTDYAGWQRQQNALAVQQVVESAIERLTGVYTPVIGASRTDAGVHALGQRAHFDTESRIPPDKLPFALNTVLPRDIRATACREVSTDTHARFSAAGKEYTYRIHNAPHASAIYRNFSAHVPLPLDIGSMSLSLTDILGTRDFTAFQASGGTARTTVRTIESASIVKSGDDITLTIRGNAFLYNMVRIIAGTLIGIGSGKLSPDSLSRALETGDRLCLGVTAPARGLTLVSVRYPFEG